MPFALNAYCNPYLPANQTRVDAILKITADLGASVAAAPLEYAILLDTSPSMNEYGRMTAAKLAVRSAIAKIPDGVIFFVVAFADSAKVISGPVPASNETRTQADRAVAIVGFGESTSMSSALDIAAKTFSQNPNAVRVAQMFTDGINLDRDGVLAATLNKIKGRFKCECRGIGEDWNPEQLLVIATAMLGTAKIVATGADMSADLKATFDAAKNLRAGDVKLRLTVPPKMAKIVSVRQMSPTIIDLTDKVTALDDRTFDYSTGAWSSEERDYRLVLEMKQPGNIGEQLRVARTAIVNGGDIQEQPSITISWSDNDRQTALIDPAVAHYTGQAELAEAQREAFEALDRGDTQTATIRFGRALQIAGQSNNDEATVRLKKIVDVIDIDQGTVRLRAGVNKADLLDAEVSATRTVRRNPAKAN